MDKSLRNSNIKGIEQSFRQSSSMDSLGESKDYLGNEALNNSQQS